MIALLRISTTISITPHGTRFGELWACSGPGYIEASRKGTAYSADIPGSCLHRRPVTQLLYSRPHEPPLQLLLERLQLRSTRCRGRPCRGLRPPSLISTSLIWAHRTVVQIARTAGASEAKVAFVRSPGVNFVLHYTTEGTRAVLDSDGGIDVCVLFLNLQAFGGLTRILSRAGTGTHVG